MTPEDFQRKFDEALAALETGDPVDALRIADQLVAERPQMAAVRSLRTRILLHTDAADEALDEARQAVALAEKDDELQAMLGIAAWRAGRMTLAQQSLERAVRLSGRAPARLADYAWFMAEVRGPRLAEKAAREAVAADDENSTAWAALGLALFRLHRNDEAEQALRRALTLDSSDPYAQRAMLMLLHHRRQDRKAEALADLLEEMPGTEAIVESLRDEVRQRRFAGKLVRRQALPAKPVTDARRPWRWLIMAAVMSLGLCLIWQPGSLLHLLICLAGPPAILWPFRRLFG
jgi:Flp pilus assembly protein TadD